MPYVFDSEPDFLNQLAPNTPTNSYVFDDEPSGENTQTLQPSLADKIANIIAERNKQIGDIQTNTALGKISYPETVLQGAGTFLGGASDVIGDTALSALSSITPDYVKDYASQGLNRLAGTDIGKFGIDLAKSGLQKYQEFSQENPRAAKNLESAANIGMMLAPAFPGTSTSALEKSGAKSLAAKNAKNIQKLVLEKETPSIAAERALRSTEKGILRSSVYDPTDFEKKMASAVATVPGIKPARSAQYNLTKIQSAANQEGEALKSSLSNVKIAIPRKEFKAKIADAVKNLEANPILVGDAKKSADKLVKEYYKIVDSLPSTPAGLLEARKQFDKVAKSYKPTVFSADTENVFGAVTKELRKTTNDFIASKVPNISVKNSLSRQHQLLSALENIKEKVPSQGKNILSRAANKITEGVPLKKEIAGLGALAGLGYTGLLSPGSAAAAGGLYGAYRLGTSPYTRIGLGKISKSADKAVSRSVLRELVREPLKLTITPEDKEENQ